MRAPRERVDTARVATCAQCRSLSGLRWTGWRAIRIDEPDEGEVNYPEIFAALDRLGYDGYVAGEYRPRGRTEDGLGWAARYGVIKR